MKVSICLTRGLALAAISGVERYYETLESQMPLANAAELQRIKEKIQNMRLNKEQEGDEWDILKQEHEMTFEMLFPNFLRYSCMVLLYIIVENQLCKISKSVQKKRKISQRPPCLSKSKKNKSGSLIEKYENYIVYAAKIQGLQWDVLHNLNKIRICIVHASGKITGMGKKHEDSLKKLATSIRGISINGGDFRNELKPLYLEKDMLILTPEYCQQTIKDVYLFFERLCDAIPLPGLVIKPENE